MDTGHALSVWRPCLFRHVQHAGVANLEAAINAIKISISSEGGDLNVKMRVCFMFEICLHSSHIASFCRLYSPYSASFTSTNVASTWCAALPCLLPPLLSCFCGHIFFCFPSHMKTAAPFIMALAKSCFGNRRPRIGSSHGQSQQGKHRGVRRRGRRCKRRRGVTIGRPTLGTSKRSKVVRLEDQLQKNGWVL